MFWNGFIFFYFFFYFLPSVVYCMLSVTSVVGNVSCVSRVLCLPSNATDWHVVWKVAVSKVTVCVMTHFCKHGGFLFCFFWMWFTCCSRFYQVITPEEIVDPNVDEHSVMTYLSQFPKAKLKPGAPLRPKLNPKKARAYGPGTVTFDKCHKCAIKTANCDIVDIHRHCIKLSCSLQVSSPLVM